MKFHRQINSPFTRVQKNFGGCGSLSSAQTQQSMNFSDVSYKLWDSDILVKLINWTIMDIWKTPHYTSDRATLTLEH